MIPQENLRFLIDQVAQGEMTLEDVLYYLEKPYKWDAEFAAWKAHQAEGERVRAVFACDPDESAGAYELSDPKHPDFHSVHADIWDAREGK